ncbi:hypothetical protein Acr_14g0004830 [Actinidia rufa]|uniref:Uncharacterized protein n=1 Tax=Actinidia rufa TaxID=165716 RepID=A0A7J0FSC6_9ERIC|nr:hypothetical protein Acr_14g0004830 [Actinidia rufa]
MYHVDLRFVVLAVINLSLFLQHHHQNGKSNWDPNESILNLNFWVLPIFISLFLLTSVKLPLDVSVIIEPIRIQAGEFSIPLAVSVMASLFLPQSLFWVGFGIVICVSPWHNLFSDLVVGFLCQYWTILRAVPVLIISCIVQKNSQVEVVEDIGGCPLELQPSLESDSVLDV